MKYTSSPHYASALLPGVLETTVPSAWGVFPPAVWLTPPFFLPQILVSLPGPLHLKWTHPAHPSQPYSSSSFSPEHSSNTLYITTYVGFCPFLLKRMCDPCPFLLTVDPLVPKQHGRSSCFVNGSIRWQPHGHTTDQHWFFF